MTFSFSGLGGLAGVRAPKTFSATNLKNADVDAR